MSLATYFDHNATTPVSPAAREAWMEACERFWQNPSSLYREAGAAKRRLEEAREIVADRLGAEPERVIFTSGATEANNAVLRSVAGRSPEMGCLISTVEHPSVREPARREFRSDRLEEIPVHRESGAIDLDFLSVRLRGDRLPGLVSVMAANNETGALQPWREAARLCRDAGVPFHCDAAQWIGKRPASGFGESCGYLTGCAHKFGGPKGVGFLLIPESEQEFFCSQIGGPQESGHRAGTEDLPGILGMLAAWDEKPDADLAAAESERLAARRTFETALVERLPGTRIIAPEADRLWNTVMYVAPDHPNLKWLTRLSAAGFAVSTGSACSAGRGNPSHVMAAMGLDFEEMGRVIRVSGGWETSPADWSALVDALVAVSADLDSGKRDLGGMLGGGDG
ncbi:MAG: cysteine desulfurase [Verrucomicrobiae bacterium]|nr:cysteine desulfurase [Verrucomicrobiae bacterium]